MIEYRLNKDTLIKLSKQEYENFVEQWESFKVTLKLMNKNSLFCNFNIFPNEQNFYFDGKYGENLIIFELDRLHKLKEMKLFTHSKGKIENEIDYKCVKSIKNNFVDLIKETIKYL